MKKCILILYLFSYSCLNAQESQQLYNQEIQFRPALSIFNNSFNSKDYYYGLSMGIEDISYQWGARFNFQFRPFFKRTQILESEDTIRQFREKKYILSIDLDKRFLHFDMGKLHAQAFLGCQIGILFGNYRGTRKDPDNLYNLSPMGGICFNIKDEILIKAGLIYIRDELIEVSDIKMLLNVVFVFPKQEHSNEEIPIDSETEYYFDE